MEAAASVAVAPRLTRKEWRAVSDHNEDLDRAKLGQGDERLIYEPLTDFCPITSDHEVHIDEVVKQRQQLQHLEVNLKAQILVLGMRERFDSQIQEQIDWNAKLQEQLHEREKAIMDLQTNVDDKDKELHVIKLEHEAAWAKEDLLREQNKELATYRRERDNSEAERAQHLQKIHELQEHVQEKERQFLELQDQHRVAQETILYKDEQIREAQAWIARAQEMDALQSTTNHSPQAELRERTEQYNQLWIGCQRQFSEMERLHLHTLQQLESELSEARERNGNKSSGNQINVKEASHFVHGNESQLEASAGSNPESDSRRLQNGDAEIVSSKTDDIPAVMRSKSLHGMPPYFSSGQLHSFLFHHPQNVNSHLVQSHIGQFHSLAASSSIPHWQNQQALSEILQMSNREQQSSQNDQNLLRPETSYDYEASVNGQTLGSDFPNVIPSSTNEKEQQGLQQISSQLHGSLRLNSSDNEIAPQEKISNFVSNHKVEAQNSITEQLGSAAIASQSVKISGVTPNKVDSVTRNFSVGKAADNLFDEETLLACVVRTIPPGSGGRIQISSALLSRLTKMLAPLHWSDYESKHGKLDVFLRGHPELFVIEGDYIQVQEGAQEIIAGMVARAKVRAAIVAASAAAAHPSLVSSVAVTPMAQTRLKQGPSINSYFSEPHHPNGVSFNPVGVRVLSKHNDQMKQMLVNGNGTNLDRPTLGAQGKVVNSGMPGPSYHAKHQPRSTGGLLGSRK